MSSIFVSTENDFEILKKRVSTVKRVKDLHDTNIMEELQKQNIQLKEIASHLSVIELKNGDKEKLTECDTLLDTLQTRLKEFVGQTNQLSQKMQIIKSERAGGLPMNDNQIQMLQNHNHSEESIESLTRSTYNNIEELWYFINSQLRMIKDHSLFPSEMKENVDDIINDIRSRKSAAQIEMELLQQKLAKSEAIEMMKLQKLVQKRLYYLQNPKKCENARKLVCNINKGCGFGCQVHHIAYCFIVAIGTERTLILESKNWKYSGEGWESVFQPLSSTCTDAGPKRIELTEKTKNDQVVALGVFTERTLRPPYMPLAVPEDLAPKLAQYHGNPAVWWLGQVVHYLMRPRAWLQEALAEFQKTIGFDHPIVGIHVRRTDKGSEAAFHDIAEYMVHVDDWYYKEDMKRQRQSQPKIETRRVYVASDDATILAGARKLYPGYKFIGDADISKSAATSTRYSKTGLIGVITDVFMLSKCNYLVGTFSSRISRLSYELMQTLHPDASTYAHSLDDVHFFTGQGQHNRQALYDHVPKSKGKSLELEFVAGDLLGVAGNHWDGYSKGKLRRTGVLGLYPLYKVKEIISTAKFPTYPEADELYLNETDRIF